MKVLILGGNGFIGSHIADHALKLGHSVRIFDRQPEHFRQANPQIEYILGAFSDTFAIAEALTGMDIVYHCISTTFPGTSNLDPMADIRDNLIASVALLEQMVKSGVRRIVFPSSGGTVYGNPQIIPVPESHPLNPICSYGVVKVAIENYLYMYQKLHGISPLIFRIANPYGPRQGHINVQGLITTFLNKTKSGEKLTVWGDGTVVRDYIFIDDIAELLAIAGSSNITGIFNLGYGRGYSINQIIGYMTEVTNTHPEIDYVSSRSFDIKEIVLDTTKCCSVFGWQPKTSLKQGIAKHWEWLNTLSI